MVFLTFATGAKFGSRLRGRSAPRSVPGSVSFAPQESDSLLNPDYAVDIYCGLKIHAVPPKRDFTILVLNILMNMSAGQNRSNCAFRNGFLFLATMPTA